MVTQPILKFVSAIIRCNLHAGVKINVRPIYVNVGK